MNYIVLGLQYGDEGKGLTVDRLCAVGGEKSCVVRFNGGHQAGHTVEMEDGRRHVFSSFGSGTFRGASTYWSKYCTVYPTAFLSELETLKQMGVSPSLYVDFLCPVTTPYDIAWNRAQEIEKGNGSVGVGFGATIERHENYYKLVVGDLRNEIVYAQKIKHIAAYYQQKISSKSDDFLSHFVEYLNGSLFWFNQDVQKYVKSVNIVQEKSFFKNYHFEDYIFEGAQGIMLDMDFGFFPNVTRSNTTSKNALSIIRDNGLDTPEIYYITRWYATRHGMGFLPNEKYSHLLFLQNNENETNVTDDWQGNFRKTILDIDQLKYAIDCDMNFHNAGIKKNLVITCVDQIYKIDFYIVENDKITMISNVEYIYSKLNLDGKLCISSAPFSTPSILITKNSTKCQTL